MTHPIFEQACREVQLKIDRASRHVNELRAIFKDYTDGDFFELVEVKSPNGLQTRYRAVAHPISETVGLVIGDAFHALSSAYDYLATGLMRTRGESTSRTHFPKNASKDDLEKSFQTSSSNKALEREFPGFCKMVVEEIEAYPDGRYGMWEIREADNLDKHNIIMPSVSIASLTGAVVVGKGNGVQFNLSAKADAGKVVELASVGGFETIVLDKGKADAKLWFAPDERSFLRGEVIPSLIGAINATADGCGVVTEFGRKALAAAS